MTRGKLFAAASAMLAIGGMGEYAFGPKDFKSAPQRHRYRGRRYGQLTKLNAKAKRRTRNRIARRSRRVNRGWA